jgi:hypothetical protein
LGTTLVVAVGALAARLWAPIVPPAADPDCAEALLRLAAAVKLLAAALAGQLDARTAGTAAGDLVEQAKRFLEAEP